MLSIIMICNSFPLIFYWNQSNKAFIYILSKILMKSLIIIYLLTLIIYFSVLKNILHFKDFMLSWYSYPTGLLSFLTYSCTYLSPTMASQLHIPSSQKCSGEGTKTPSTTTQNKFLLHHCCMLILFWPQRQARHG